MALFTSTSGVNSKGVGFEKQCRTQIQLEPPSQSPRMLSLFSFNRFGPEPTRIFEELPRAIVVQVSRPDAGYISPMQLSYVIEVQYREFKWLLNKKASQVLYLHFALKKRAFIKEIHEKREQVKEWLHNVDQKKNEWLQNMGIVDSATVLPVDGDEDVNIPIEPDEHAKKRDVPSSAAFPVIRPTLNRLHSISDRAKVAMQGYLNNFVENLNIVNSREVCGFLEVSTLSFASQYGPKLREDYLMVKHLPKISKNDDHVKCCDCNMFGWCSNNWQYVWVVLKPGFLALLSDPFDEKPLDVIIFDVLPMSGSDGTGQVSLAEEVKESNPLRHAFKVACGNRNIRLRTKNNSKTKDWVLAINDIGSRFNEGWYHPHRFGSFASPRGLLNDGSLAQWFVDGQATFEAIASAIEKAKLQIFICGWWVCPELYLRRPFQEHASSRFDALLEEKAKQGVQIYILLYKEVALALKINSLYSKRRLQSIHENVRVLRFPDHFSTGVYLWSHHEKIVIIDYQLCFLGGIDLCFGRYDTNNHKLCDFPPTLWPGKDYYNPRESEPISWEEVMKDELDRNKYPRMPWHDVHCALRGPPCLDIAMHFVQRWNHAKRNKAQYEQTIPFLMPQHHIGIPKETNTKANDTNLSNRFMKNEYHFGFRSSFKSPSLPLPHEASIDGDAYKINRFDEGCHDMHEEPRKTNKGGVISDACTIPCDKDCGDHVPTLEETKQIGSFVSCRCQIIRSVSQWSVGTSQTEQSIHNAYCSLIEKAEHFIYIENQFFISSLSSDEVIQNRILDALYRRIIRAYNDKTCFRVIIVLPLLPGFQGGVDDSGAASVRAIMHWQYRTISRGKGSLLYSIYALIGPKMQDYISFYGLRVHGELSEDGSIITSQVYVHSKIMIVDDCIALIGSANINDRSLLGSRDSEIGVVVEDNEVVTSQIGGKPWKAGKFAHSLRLSLWSEHLGLEHGEISQIHDPVIDSTYKDIWMATAMSNTQIYQDVFGCIPSDDINSRTALRQAVVQLKDKVTHTTIDLGVAPRMIESSHINDVKCTNPLEKLRSIKGHLVTFPLKFMLREDLRPVFNESEYYASPHVFQ